jgi:hypothetical protein
MEPQMLKNLSGVDLGLIYGANGIPDPHLHSHCYAFNTTWDDVEKKWKAGQFRDLKADAPYFEAVFHARFARQLAGLGLCRICSSARQLLHVSLHTFAFLRPSSASSRCPPTTY